MLGDVHFEYGQNILYKTIPSKYSNTDEPLQTNDFSPNKLQTLS